ncbi:hypothetical protein FDP41_006981 [Naegleria fowleri]|uniref:PTHB1 N-terminal domain-containing protein n=1 Tax=Naegleria fowleri TaxID=5763 RepID=A0A6A5BIX2_NAEFO|nr:uncharacterized protein FDP41_006981 [Naegleria fowleri]KAF0973998.1 hypothetical protein FDP41_006981 [Naegleria fowleri]
MSLFRLRESWSTKCGDSEEFEKGSLCIGNVDNERGDSGSCCLDKIVVGSLSGMLRIYKPQKNNYYPTDLLLEKQLEAPILQLEIGKFIPNSRDNALGVLMPKKFAVYTIVKQTSDYSSEQQDSNAMEGYALQLYYEHTLQRLSYNFCYGPFGGAYGKDYICIQSFDGQLSFFEQDHFTFQRFLSTSLIPGPLIYSRSMDSFITFNSSMEVEAYKYQMLAASSGSTQKENSNGKKVKATWTVNVGEEVYDIVVGRYSQYLSAGQSEILAVGERTLFSIKENGELASQMRFDYFPSAVELYKSGTDQNDRSNLIIGTHNKTVMIYSDPKLAWAAGMTSIPVAIRVANIGGVKGAIVTLDEEGNLALNYLGTGAISNTVPTLENKDVDYERLEEETKRLQQIIRRTKRNQKDESSEALVIRAQIPNAVDPESFNTSNENKRVTIQLYIGYTGNNCVLENITVNFHVEKPFYVISPTTYITTLNGGNQSTPFVLPVTVFGGSDCTPKSLEASVTAIYHDPVTGQPKISNCHFLLPFGLCGDVVPAKKNSTHKITLDTNKSPIPIASLFEDLIQKDEMSNLISENILTFQYSNGKDATILVSKNAGRYRVQSSSLDAMYILVKETIRRLKQCAAALHMEDKQQMKIEFTENMPFYPYFDVIDSHFKNRLGLQIYYQQLDKLAAQFRALQKRLLVRYKDKNPTSINSLDILFDKTYQEILGITKKIEKTQQSLKEASHDLTCSTLLMHILVKLRYSLDDKEMEVLENHWPSFVNDESPGWEETLDFGLTQLLNTVLTKNPKEKNLQTELEMPADSSRLKKRIASVVEKLQNFKLLPAEAKDEKKK